MHLNTITKLLDIPNYRAVEVTDGEYENIYIVLEREEDTLPVCSGCGNIHGRSVHSRGDMLVEDLRISGKRVFLLVPKRKVQYAEDSTIRVEELQWLNGRFTARFAEQVYRLTSITTNQEAGWFLGLDDETVYRIDKRKLEELALEKLDPVPAPKHMSVDEVAWQKWHKYVTNVVDVDQRKVIWNHQDRGKVNLDKFFHSLEEENCEKIEAVACDGARGYLSSIKQHAKNALIVPDHFHVKKYLNDALDTVRKEELKRARQQNNGELSAILHCNKRFILMQNKVTNKKQDLLEKLASLNERVYQAMLLKEQFISIYTDPKTAMRTLKEWIIAAIKSKIPAFVELGYKFFRKRHYLLNYFLCKITTAISEGINNKR
ncbi:MAG: ISL3 family transposase [Syntrophales bacterium]|nr:ISL3 family transposase [Syntrophales bacterium]